MATKRPSQKASQGGSSSAADPPAKKADLNLSSSVDIGAVSTEEELDIKILKVQNARLYAALEERKSQEDEFEAQKAHMERLRKVNEISYHEHPNI